MLKSYQILTISIGLLLASCGQSNTNTEANSQQDTTTKHPDVVSAPHTTVINTPDEALLEMQAGNQRFLENKPVNTDYKKQIEATKNDQHPHTVILSCLDSRIPPEIIFDQGIGNLFVARVAGNIEEPNILGSMEFATKVKGTKLIIVMGHNKCGAVKGAIDDADLGHLTQLVAQIKPSIVGDTTNREHMQDETAKNNVIKTMKDITERSSVINGLIKEGKVKIVGAFYDITTGKVTFLN